MNSSMTGAIRRPRTWRAILTTALARRPVAAALTIAAGDVLIRVALQLGVQALIGPQWAELVTLVILTALTLGLIALLGWWGPAGFNRPAAWRSPGLLWLPAALTFVLPFVAGFRGAELPMAGVFAVAYLLVGLREEALFRGVVLRALERLGPMGAATPTSVLFGLTHLANLFFRESPGLVLAQVVGAMTTGFGYAALRLRTNTLWPLIVLHAFEDLTLHYSNLPVIPIQVIRGVTLVIYGAWLLRGWSVEHQEETR